MGKGAILWEYADKSDQDNKEIRFDLEPKQAILEVKLHNLTITNRELINDILILTYS